MGWTGLGGGRLDQCPGAKGGELTGASPVDRGKPGSKIHVMSDRAGLPLAVLISAANTADTHVLLPLLDSVTPIRSRHGWPRRKPAKLHADKAYDSMHCHSVIGHVATGRGAADGRLTGQAVSYIVNRAAHLAEIDPAACWSSHALRSGFATRHTVREPIRCALPGTAAGEFAVTKWLSGAPTRSPRLTPSSPPCRPPAGSAEESGRPCSRPRKLTVQAVMASGFRKLRQTSLHLAPGEH
ncbi:transposase [Catellatospora sp. NEAU-YM18]|nr:transposase [Catellatospora tritici]